MHPTFCSTFLPQSYLIPFSFSFRQSPEATIFKKLENPGRCCFFSLLFKVPWTVTRESQADYSRNSLNSQNPHSHNPEILYAVLKPPKQFSFLSALHRNGQNSTFYQTSKRNFYSTLIPFCLPTPTVMPPAVTSFSGALAVRHSNLGIITWKLYKFFYAWNNSSYYTFQQSQVAQAGSLGLTLSERVNCFAQGE